MTTPNLPAVLCDVCKDPGHCCKRFTIHRENGTITYWKRNGTALDVLVDMAMRFLPFLPEASAGEWNAPEAEGGEPYVAWWVKCPDLLPTGRCGNYEFRPQLCRDFAPASSPLCVHWSQ